MLQFVWSLLILLFRRPSVPVLILSWLYPEQQSKFVSLSLNVLLYFQFSRKVQVLIFLFDSFQFYFEVSRDIKVHILASSLSFVDVILLHFIIIVARFPLTNWLHIYKLLVSSGGRLTAILSKSAGFYNVSSQFQFSLLHIIGDCTNSFNHN